MANGRKLKKDPFWLISKGVGHNVQDHLMMFLDFVSKNESVSKPYVHLLNEPINLAKYALLDRTGPSCNYGIEAGLFIR